MELWTQSSVQSEEHESTLSIDPHHLGFLSRSSELDIAFSFHPSKMPLAEDN
jgi:hypothetical protein